MSHKKGTGSDQLLLLPPSLEDCIDEDNPVRVIKAFVKSLDLEKLRFEKARCKETGCKPCHPGDLLQLYMYGYVLSYDKTTDSYQCPMGQTLTTNGSLYNIRGSKGHPMVRQYKTRFCSKCENSSKRTSSARGQGCIIQRSIYQEAVEANNHRVITQKEKYRRRQEMVEHPFGVVKRQWGYDHVLLKGIDKVEAESNLIFLCYNLKRVINISGINVLIKRLQEIFLFLTINGFKLNKIPNQNFSGLETKTKNRVDTLISDCLKTLNLNMNIYRKFNFCTDSR